MTSFKQFKFQFFYNRLRFNRSIKIVCKKLKNKQLNRFIYLISLLHNKNSMTTASDVTQMIIKYRNQGINIIKDANEVIDSYKNKFANQKQHIQSELDQATKIVNRMKINIVDQELFEKSITCNFDTQQIDNFKTILLQFMDDGDELVKLIKIIQQKNDEYIAKLKTETESAIIRLQSITRQYNMTKPNSETQH